MNILIPDSWLREYIKTNAKPIEIGDALSLHSFSVEKLHYDDNDVIYEIEVTPNRGDALSVLGIARELKAVLPKLGFQCKLKKKKTTSSTIFNKTAYQNPIEVVINDEDTLISYAAVVMDKINIEPSPMKIKRRLEQAGIRALNNVIDITNYIMVAVGQPMHAFDYDKIQHHKMIVRLSKKGELLTTLDSKIHELPEGAIVIEDGAKNLIDLCGIMGAKNSEITSSTRRVLFLVPIYNKAKIRKTSMFIGNRSEAALRFEKGLDQSNVLPALMEAIRLTESIVGASVSSRITESIQNPQTRSVYIDTKKIALIAGMKINTWTIKKILKNLGFKIKGSYAEVPSWRTGDIELPEDLAEEIIRIHGYENIKGELPINGSFKAENSLFLKEDKVKDFLKYQGFYECYTNSATNLSSQENKPALRLSNPLNENFEVLRTSLIPQLTETLAENAGFKEKIKIFEIASVYVPSENGLPHQPLILGIVTKNVNKQVLKGIIESLYDELHVENHPTIQIKELQGVLSFEIDLEHIFSLPEKPKSYSPISQFNYIKEDVTLVAPDHLSYQEIINTMQKVDSRIASIEYVDKYHDAITLKIKYLDKNSQIDSKEVQKIREKMLKALESKKIYLKTLNPIHETTH